LEKVQPNIPVNQPATLSIFSLNLTGNIELVEPLLWIEVAWVGQKSISMLEY